MTDLRADESALLALMLPARAEAPGAARRALAALNGDLHLVSEPRLKDAELLVTELVTNAIRHGDTDTVSLAVRATGATLRVEVGQGAPAPLAQRNPATAPEEPGGWGLRIVDVIAHAWGTEGDGETAVVWFEIDRPQAETPVEASGAAPPPAALTESSPPAQP